MCVGNEFVDRVLVLFEEGVYMLLVDETCTLSLWEDEVEKEEGSEPGVEGNPEKC